MLAELGHDKFELGHAKAELAPAKTELAHAKGWATHRMRIPLGISLWRGSRRTVIFSAVGAILLSRA